MSYGFSLVLSREITDDEAAALIGAGPGGANLTTDTLPTDADIIVTRLDFDTEAPTLAEAINSALEALKEVPGLTAASLEVPAQPNGEPDDEADDKKNSRGEPGVVTAEVISDSYTAPAADDHAATANAQNAASGETEAASGETEAAAVVTTNGSPARKSNRSRKKPAAADGGGASN